MKLLFVCMGNICRSPLMQGIVEHRLGKAGIKQQFVLDSAGTGGWHKGELPDHRSIAIADKHGVDIRTQRARQVSTADFSQFDWLLCADHANRSELLRRSPESSEKITLFMPWCGLIEHQEIPDPYYGNANDFAQVYQMIDRATQQWIANLPLR